MTDDRLQEIRERHDKIIPGPWDWFGNTATDQVFLGTPDRGRLFILYPHLRPVEYVYDNQQGEGYELDEARQRVHTNWCLAHAEHVDKDDPGECICDELRDFLRGELDQSEGHRYFEREDRGYSVSLMRAVQVFPDLRFVHEAASDAFGGRKRQGGMMRSYREIGVRYEVLGHATLEEFEERQKLIDAEYPPHARELRPTAKQALYREDFRGIANPEAEFIAAAPQDVHYLLERLGAAEAYIEALEGPSVSIPELEKLRKGWEGTK